MGLGLGVALPVFLAGVNAAGSPLRAVLESQFFWFDYLGGHGGQVGHWLHPAGMALMLVALGGLGAYLGYRVRAARLAGEATGGITAPGGLRHEDLMTGMVGFAFWGAAAGMCTTLYEGRPLLQTPHGLTAVVSLTLLCAQGYLGYSMKGDERARAAHSVLGSATMGLLLLHGAFGAYLSISTLL